MADNVTNFEEFSRSPEWKAGLDRFLAEDFKAGDIIEKKWFFDAMQIEYPGQDMKLGRARKLELKFLEQFTLLCDHLLVSEKIALQSIGRQRYRVVPPEEQAIWADLEGHKAAEKVLKKAASRIVHVDVSGLSTEQKRERLDKLARISFIAQAAKNSRKKNFLPPKGEDLLD